MANTYTKKKTLVINGRKRIIYSKKNSRKEYIKSKGRMLNLKTYLKNKNKTKKGGGSTPPKKTSIHNRKIIKKALSFQKRREEKKKERSNNSDSPLPPPTDYFRSIGGKQSVINRNAVRRSLANIQAAKRAAKPVSYNRSAIEFNNRLAHRAQQRSYASSNINRFNRR